jgi:hypothetical protein
MKIDGQRDKNKGLISLPVEVDGLRKRGARIVRCAQGSLGAGVIATTATASEYLTSHSFSPSVAAASSVLLLIGAGLFGVGRSIRKRVARLDALSGTKTPATEKGGCLATTQTEQKWRQLVRIRQTMRMRRSATRSFSFANVSVGPAGSAAIMASVTSYICAHWLMTSFWRPVFGLCEAVAVVAAVCAYRMTRYKTYEDKIFALLASYEPLDTMAYQRLQDEIRRDPKHLDHPLELWMIEERTALDRASANQSSIQDASPLSAFLNAKTNQHSGDKKCL